MATIHSLYGVGLTACYNIVNAYKENGRVLAMTRRHHKKFDHLDVRWLHKQVLRYRFIKSVELRQKFKEIRRKSIS